MASPVKNNDKSNITIGLPKPGGALFFAPAGTTLPTTADAELGDDFVNLGYVTEDGLTVSTKEETESKDAWGPETVISSQKSYTKEYKFELMETSRPSVAQFRYGKDNVTLSSDGASVEKINDTGEQSPIGVFICDTLQNNGGSKPRIKRQIVGSGQITDRSGDEVYNNSDVVTVPITLTASKFTDTSVTGKDGAFVTTLFSSVEA